MPDSPELCFAHALCPECPESGVFEMAFSSYGDAFSLESGNQTLCLKSYHLHSRVRVKGAPGARGPVTALPPALITQLPRSSSNAQSALSEPTCLHALPLLRLRSLRSPSTPGCCPLPYSDHGMNDVGPSIPQHCSPIDGPQPCNMDVGSLLVHLDVKHWAFHIRTHCL